MKKNYLISIVFSFLILTENSFSQNIVNLENKKVVVSNDLLFYDDGGASNPIGNNPFQSVIKAQSGTVKMFFTYIDIPAGATLKIYKGLDTSELVGLFDGQHKPGNMYGEVFTLIYSPGKSIGVSRGWEGVIEPSLSGNTQKLTMPESDCVGAIPLCSNSTVNTAANQYENTGVVNDDNGSCYSGTGSGGSVWYSFTPAANGNIDFMISPLGSTDYDYVLWNITNGCANKSQVSCNFSATTGPTGLNGSGSTNSQDAQGTTNNQLESVNTTQTYAICINYYGGTNGGFNLNFQNVAGTVAVTDVTPPTIVNAYSTNCASSSTYTVNFSEYMDCITLQASDFSIPGYTVSLTTTNCVNGRTDHVAISVSPAMPAGNYTMTVNSMNDMCGNPLNSTYNINTTTIPTANAGPDAIACSSPGIFGTTNYGSVTLNGSGGTMFDWSSGQSTASITVAPTTTTTYTLTAIQGSCASTDQVIVTVSPAPLPNLGPDQTVCATFPITLTASGGTSYQWQSTTSTNFFGQPTGWANIPGAILASYTGTPSTTIYYQVIVTNAAGCQGTDYIKVNIGSGVFGITAPPFVCDGQSATLSLPASMTAYTWSVGGVPIGTANTAIVVTPGVTTTYTATSTTVGCTGTANVTVAVHSPLAITTLATPTNACVGIPVNLTSSGPTDTSSTSTENFEGASQGYTLVNGANNKWYWGTAAFATGTKGLYIGTAAANNNYEIGNAFTPKSGINFAYKDYTITSYCNANYNFKWKSNGQAAQAELTVWLVPTSYTPLAGTAIAASATNILLGGPYYGQITYQNVSIPVSSYAVQNVRIVFQWSSTGAGLFGGPTVANPAASIDDIVFSESSTYSYSWTSSPVGFLASTMNATATPISAITYNLTVTRCDGCPTTSTVNVANCTSVPDTIVPIFAAVQAICSGAALAVLPTTSTNGITGTWSPAINNTATTTYTFTPTAGQGATTTTMSITVTPNVSPTFTAVAPICSGAALAALPTTSTNGITGTWSPALNNTATTLYTYTPTTGLCATTTTLSITVNTPTTPTFAAVAPICSGAALAALPTTSTNGITGTWSPALDNTATTLYTFTPTAGLCATTTTLSITVNTPTTPTFAAVAPICSGAALAALPTTSTNGITGTWSPALDNTTTTLYTFTPTAGQCATTATLTITINSTTVTPTFTAVPAICNGAVLAALPSTSTNGISGAWSPALDNTTTTTYTFNPTAGQCATTTTLTVTVNTITTPTFAAIAPVCTGAALSALPTTSIDGITGTWSPALDNTTTTLYTFTPTAGLCATTTTLSITVNTPTTPTFAAVPAICTGSALAALPTTSTNGVTGTWSPALNNTTTTLYTFTPTAGQCASTTTLTITVNSTTVTPTFAVVAPICSGATLAALPTTSNNGISGTWSPAINNTTTTTYTFTPIVGQCATTTTMSITVNTPTTPTFAAVAPICTGAALSALPTTSINGITGTWSPAINNTANTLYTFTPTAGLCATTTSVSITVNPNLTPTFTALGPICSGSTLSALPTISTNGITGIWSPAINNTATTTYTFTPTAGQCATTTTMTITVTSCILPTANFSVSDSVICAGSCITFTNNSTVTTSWQWIFQNGTPTSSTSQNPGTICFNSAGIQQIKLVVSNTFGADSSVHFINVVQPQLVFVGNDTTIQLGQSVNLNATGVSNGVYTWAPPFDLTCNVCPNPTATPGETITYTVISTDSNGCSSSDNISIIVQFENVVFVPNIFSPNGDGVNDMLFVRGMGVSKLTFFLYDRWGEKVFETTRLDVGWDGTFRGEDMNKAVFVYYLEATFSDGKQVTQKGDITLVK